MSRTRPSLRRSPALRLWMDRATPAAAVCVLTLGGARAPAILVVAGLLAGFGWVSMQYRPGSVDRCLRAYDQARTPGDSASADQVVIGALGRSTCGHLRREGALDHHRKAAERQRTASGARRHSVMEK